ncbi:hypothetical protein [Longitalea luteola]|uniref:hypothetical protein n=1 Tax=Longitalea luteola TaxID=2812563 RepID=UPI001A956982|nr:hypothetical protein [Longitalea luteola]
MSDQGDNVVTPFMEVMTNKVQNQEEKIVSIEQKLNSIPNNSAEILEIKKEVLDAKIILKQISFPTTEMRELSSNLREGVTLLKQPVENKVTHHHYLSNYIYILFGTILCLCLAGIGWYNTWDKLNVFKENDIKYRFLRVQNNNYLRQLLKYTDSLYLYQPDIERSVIHMEDSVRERYRIIQQLEENNIENQKLQQKLK